MTTTIKEESCKYFEKITHIKDGQIIKILRKYPKYIEVEIRRCLNCFAEYGKNNKVRIPYGNTFHQYCHLCGK